MVECIRKRLTIRLVFLKHLQADRSISATQQFPNQTSPKKPLGLSQILESPLPSHGSNFKPHFPPMNIDILRHPPLAAFCTSPNLWHPHIQEERAGSSSHRRSLGDQVTEVTEEWERNWDVSQNISKCLVWHGPRATTSSLARATG